MKQYKQLTIKERYQIKAFLEINLSRSEIARKLDRDKSAISREILRNNGPGRYDPELAQKRYENKKRNSTKYTALTPEMKETVVEKIKLDWSPEQIVGHCKKKGIKMACHQTIYTYIETDRISGGDLYKHLRHSKKRRKKRGSKDNRGQIKNRVSIEERPEIVNQKSRFGDWEGDLIIGKDHKGAIVTLTERFTKLTVLKRVHTKDAEEVKSAIINTLSAFAPCSHTLTLDNGKEFAKHEEIKEKLGIKVYFAHPYSSWERGLNENTNGLIRQYLPKKSIFENVSEEELQRIISQLNLRPRKSLGFASPAEAFANMMSRW